MTVTVVLDGQALHGWAAEQPPRPLLTVMEVLRRHGSGRVVVPSVVTVEALRGDTSDGPVERILRAVELESVLPLPHARAAARLRQGLAVSAADAVVAEVAIRHHADYLVTADGEDMAALTAAAGADGPAIVTI